MHGPGHEQADEAVRREGHVHAVAVRLRDRLAGFVADRIARDADPPRIEHGHAVLRAVHDHVAGLVRRAAGRDADLVGHAGLDADAVAAVAGRRSVGRQPDQVAANVVAGGRGDADAVLAVGDPVRTRGAADQVAARTHDGNPIARVRHRAREVQARADPVGIHAVRMAPRSQFIGRGDIDRYACPPGRANVVAAVAADPVRAGVLHLDANQKLRGDIGRRRMEADEVVLDPLVVGVAQLHAHFAVEAVADHEVCRRGFLDPHARGRIRPEGHVRRRQADPVAHDARPAPVAFDLDAALAVVADIVGLVGARAADDRAPDALARNAAHPVADVAGPVEPHADSVVLDQIAHPGAVQPDAVAAVRSDHVAPCRIADAAVGTGRNDAVQAVAQPAVAGVVHADVVADDAVAPPRDHQAVGDIGRHHVARPVDAQLSHRPADPVVVADDVDAVPAVGNRLQPRRIHADEIALDDVVGRRGRFVADMDAVAQVAGDIVVLVWLLAANDAIHQPVAADAVEIRNGLVAGKAEVDADVVVVDLHFAARRKLDAGLAVAADVVALERVGAAADPGVAHAVQENAVAGIRLVRAVVLADPVGENAGALARAVRRLPLAVLDENAVAAVARHHVFQPGIAQADRQVRAVDGVETMAPVVAPQAQLGHVADPVADDFRVGAIEQPQAFQPRSHHPVAPQVVPGRTVQDQPAPAVGAHEILRTYPDAAIHHLRGRTVGQHDAVARGIHHDVAIQRVARAPGNVDARPAAPVDVQPVVAGATHPVAPDSGEIADRADARPARRHDLVAVAPVGKLVAHHVVRADRLDARPAERDGRPAVGLETDAVFPDPAPVALQPDAVGVAENQIVPELAVVPNHAHPADREQPRIPDAVEVADDRNAEVGRLVVADVALGDLVAVAGHGEPVRDRAAVDVVAVSEQLQLGHLDVGERQVRAERHPQRRAREDVRQDVARSDPQVEAVRRAIERVAGQRSLSRPQFAAVERVVEHRARCQRHLPQPDRVALERDARAQIQGLRVAVQQAIAHRNGIAVGRQPAVWRNLAIFERAAAAGFVVDHLVHAHVRGPAAPRESDAVDPRAAPIQSVDLHGGEERGRRGVVHVGRQVDHVRLRRRRIDPRDSPREVVRFHAQVFVGVCQVVDDPCRRPRFHRRPCHNRRQQPPHHDEVPPDGMPI